MKTYFYQIALALLFLTTGCHQKKMEKKEVEKKKPNVIFILADDLGYNDVSSYRNKHLVLSINPPTSQTPNIDKLYSQGMGFTDFYCGAAVCSPSRSALMTGRNASRVGIYNWIPSESPMHMRDEEVTIAEILKNENYQTGHFGKWHLTSEGTEQPHPNDQGFDFSFYSYNNAKPSHHNPENYFKNGNPMGKMNGYACQIVVDQALEWLEIINSTDNPFYLNLWFNEPHLQVAAPEELTKRHQYNQEYYGAIENMDLAVGRVLSYLIEHNLEDNTIVFFSSDNGSRWDHSNDPLRGEKCFNYEGGLRVPFIVKWPGKIPSGTVNHFPGSFTDILPSIVDLVGAKLPNRKLDGISLAEVFKGSTPDGKREDPIFFYRYFHDPICMLRQGDWCLLGYQNLIPKAENLDEVALAILKPKEGEAWSQWSFQPQHMEFLKSQEPVHFELYNLKNDKEQEFNIADQNPERVAVMKEQMHLLRKEMVEEGGDWFQ